MRYRHNTLAVFRRALTWGLVCVLVVVIFKFIFFMVSLIANLNPEPDFPRLLRLILGFYCIAAFYSILVEFHPRCLTITSKYISLKFSNNPFIRKPLQEIKDIKVLYHSGSKLALKIFWLKGQGSPWVVAGTITDSTLEDPLTIIETLLDPKKLAQFTSQLPMRWKSQKQLQLAGWHPGRNVHDYTNPEMNEPAQKTLRQFGGLHVSCIPPGAGTLIFETPEDDRSQQDLQYFSDKSGLNLSFIGVCHGGDFVPIVVSQYGYVYLIAGNEMHGIGTSVTKAIDSLIGGKQEEDVLTSKQLGTYKRKTQLPPNK